MQVFRAFKEISAISGDKSQDRKKNLIVKLLAGAKDEEAGYVMRALQVGGGSGGGGGGGWVGGWALECVCLGGGRAGLLLAGCRRDTACAPLQVVMFLS